MPTKKDVHTHADKPYVENYPALKAWLDKHDARCLSQAEGPNDSSLEMWAAPGTNVFVVQVYAGRRGWDIFTASGTIQINATLADAEKRLGLTEEKT